MTSRAVFRIAYLTSQYPMLSMSFVLREVFELRRLGAEIDVASINRPDRAPAVMTAEERSEAARTRCIKGQGVQGALLALADAIRRHPAQVIAAVGDAVRMGGLDLRRLAMNLAYFAEAMLVGRWMRETSHHHLHVHLGSQPLTVGMFVKRVFGCTLSATVHGPDEFDDVKGQYLREKVAACDFICCISHFARSQLMRVSRADAWSKLLVFRLGVDPGRFTPSPREAASVPFCILCVGRLVPAKGQHLLLQAVARLLADGIDLQLVIVGDGIDRATLEGAAQAMCRPDAVTFTGGVSQDDILAHYGRADCFCLPSFAEGIPVVLMEAMAMEIPVVTTRITGIPELVRDGVDGLLVAPSDLDALIEALRSLALNPALRRRLGIGARRHILAEYDLAANVALLFACFRERVSPR